MSKATEKVNAFLKAWEPAGGYRDTINSLFTPDCIYENVGVSVTTGPAEAIAFLDAFGEQLGFVSMIVEMRAMVDSGSTVMTERTDHLYDSAGRRIASLRVMGVFEIRDGKIAAWRDYFDSVALKPS